MTMLLLILFFLEHTRELGVTVEDIALDKSCIITGKQKCIFIAEQTETILKIIEDRCRNYKTLLKVYGKDFYCENI